MLKRTFIIMSYYWTYRFGYRIGYVDGSGFWRAFARGLTGGSRDPDTQELLDRADALIDYYYRGT